MANLDELRNICGAGPTPIRAQSSRRAEHVSDPIRSLAPTVEVASAVAATFAR